MASGIRAGKAYVELLLTDDGFKQGLSKAKARLNAFASSMASAAAPLAAFGASITAPLGLAVKSFVSIGDAMDKMSARTGVAVEALSELSFAAERSGTSIEDVETSIKFLQRNIVDASNGVGEAKDAFAELGIEAAKLNGLNPDQQFTKIANAINSVSDPTEKAALALDIFGRSGTQILPLIRDMGDLRSEARALGLTMSTEQATAAARLNDLWGDLKMSAQAIAREIGSALSPALESLATNARDVAGNIIEWVRNNQGVVVALAAIGATASAVASSMFAIAAASKAAAFTVSGIRGLADAYKAVASSAALASMRTFNFSKASLAAKAGAVGLAAAVATIGYEAGAAIGKLSGFEDWFSKFAEPVFLSDMAVTDPNLQRRAAELERIGKLANQVSQEEGRASRVRITRQAKIDRAKKEERGRAVESAARLDLSRAQIALAAEERAFSERLKAAPTDALSIATGRFSEAQQQLADALFNADKAARDARVEGTEAAKKRAEAAGAALDVARDSFNRWQSALDESTAAVAQQAEERKRLGEEAIAQERELLDRAAAVRMANTEDIARREQEAQRAALSDLVQSDPSTALEEFQGGLSDAEAEVARIEAALAQHEAAFRANPAKSTANLEMMESMNAQLIEARDAVEYFSDGVGQANDAIMQNLRDSVTRQVESAERLGKASQAGTFSASATALRAIQGPDPLGVRQAVAAEEAARTLKQMYIDMQMNGGGGIILS